MVGVKRAIFRLFKNSGSCNVSGLWNFYNERFQIQKNHLWKRASALFSYMNNCSSEDSVNVHTLSLYIKNSRFLCFSLFNYMEELNLSKECFGPCFRKIPTCQVHNANLLKSPKIHQWKEHFGSFAVLPRKQVLKNFEAGPQRRTYYLIN